MTQYAQTNVVILAISLSSGLAIADSESDKAWMAVMAKQADRYEFVFQTRKEKITMTEKPVFRHDAPSRQSDDIGGVWIWSDENSRSVAAGTVFGWTSAPNTRSVIHEFCSLSREPFTATYSSVGGKETWNPHQTAEWKPIPNAPKPSEKKTVFRAQLKRQARRFAAHTFDYANERWQLRLIPTPVYQYESPQLENTLGGAVFVICQDTNTDVIVAIEAVRDKPEDDFRFEYTLGSFTDWSLHVELDGKEIWSEKKENSRDSTDQHWVRRTNPIQLPENATNTE